MWGFIVSLGTKAVSKVAGGNISWYLVGILVVAITAGSAYFFMKIADQNEQIGNLGIANAQLQADKVILQGNLEGAKAALSDNRKEFKEYRDLYGISEGIVITLQAEVNKSHSRILKLSQDLSKFQIDEDSDEAKVLLQDIPNSLIELWHDGVLPIPKSDMPSAP